MFLPLNLITLNHALSNTAKNTQLSSFNGPKKCVHCKNNLYVNEGFFSPYVGVGRLPHYVQREIWKRNNHRHFGLVCYQNSSSEITLYCWCPRFQTERIFHMKMSPVHTKRRRCGVFKFLHLFSKMIFAHIKIVMTYFLLLKQPMN